MPRTEPLDGVQADEPLPYEPPSLKPIGSLHDLLAGGGTQPCDMGSFSPGPSPQTSPGPPFCS